MPLLHGRALSPILYTCWDQRPDQFICQSPKPHPTFTHPRHSMRQVPTYESTQPLTSSRGNTPRSLGNQVGSKATRSTHHVLSLPPWGALHQFSPLILTAILHCAHSTGEKNWGTQEEEVCLRSSGWRVQRWKSDPSWVHTAKLTTGEPWPRVSKDAGWVFRSPISILFCSHLLTSQMP